MHSVAKLGALTPLLWLAACGSTSEEATPRPLLYEGFAGYHRAVTTRSAEAQRWFDQGLQLLYGYNHDEAIRSFAEAGRLDPDCVMAHWGVAYANGLHINNPQMTAEKSRAAWEAVQEGLRRVAAGNPVERALMHATATRYAWPVPEDRRPLDEAYAAAMEEVWGAHPEDPDVGALFAESLMNLQPWDLWTAQGEPKGRTLDIVATLERVLALAPRHPGANHFYIHTVEASKQPERAVPAAERLVDLVPGSGHLVHMPSHVFVRVGRWADAADANARAIAADEAYFARAPAPDFYSLYFLHNVHFLAYAAMMEGRREVALAAARDLERKVPAAFLENYVHIADGLMTTSLHVMIRFGLWNEILAEPDYPAFRRLSRAQRHYARCVALSALGLAADARREIEAFEAVAATVPAEWSVGNNPAAQVLELCRRMMHGELLYREGDHEAAFASLREGARLEDELVYDEPPGWMQPVRHALGALLLAQGRVAEAEGTYREDLARHPGNGWSLLGLERALALQGEEAAAAEVRARRAVVWKRADVTPTSSCYCEPGR